MTCVLASAEWFMYIGQVYTPNAAVVCVIIFNVAFGLSGGLYLSYTLREWIIPVAFRAKGVSTSTATNWLFNWIVGQVTPTLQEVITWRLYPMHAFFCLCSLILGTVLPIPGDQGDTTRGDGRGVEPITGNDDDDSETSSLVRGRPRTYGSPAGSRRLSPAPTEGKKEWFQNVFGGGSGGQKYQAVPSEGGEGV
ncbi:hypothetical protein FRC09_016739 [Ceratobasidium sp. 395]|nr:hypothetical protein FRC09_016739 [Ceratobasidium sp. 395]